MWIVKKEKTKNRTVKHKSKMSMIILIIVGALSSR